MTSTTSPPDAGVRPQISRKARLAERGIDGTLWLLVPAALVIGGLFLYPFIYGISISFQPLKGTSAWANYTKFFSDPYMLDAIWKTVRLAVPAAAVSVLLAAPIAYQARRNFRGRGMIILLLMLPLTFGSILIAQGMGRALAPFGWVNLALEAVGLPPGDFLYNYTGTLIAGVLTTLPFSFLLLMGFFGGIDPSLERAAAAFGASRAARFWRITLPLALPGLVTTLMLALVEAFAIFPSAILVGQPDNATHVLTIPIYQAASQQSDYGKASAIAIILTLLELVILGVMMAVRGLVYSGPATGGKG
jgi:putative spermidine/putrescine transport system permease protein